MQTVLLIDDNAQLLAYCRRLLEENGYRVAEARDGRAGLDAFRRERPDVVVCDVFMPVMDGLGFLREARAIDSGAKVIAMSGGGDFVHGDYLHAARLMGATGVLDKPFGRARLLDAVRTALAG